jgi:hypothetical protein
MAFQIGPIDGVSEVELLGDKVRIGTFASATTGGAIVSATNTSALAVYADDGGVALAGSTTIRAAHFRNLVTTATAAASSIFGSQSQLKAIAGMTGSGYKAASWGYLETSGTQTTGSGYAGVRATIDIPSGVTIGSGCIVSGLMVDSIDLGGTHTGKAVAINVPNPLAGTWDALFNVGSSSGCYGAQDVGTAATKQLIVMVDGSPLAIKLYAVGT